MGLFRSIASGLDLKSVDASPLTWQKIFGDEGRVKSGVAVNVDSALGVSTVIACLRVLANGVSQVPLKVYRENAAGDKNPAKDHPSYKLLWRQPNDWMTSFDFRRVMMVHAVLAGNAYAYIGWGGAGQKRRVIELIPLCGKVVPRQSRDYTLTYEVYDDKGVIDVLARENVLHVRGLGWNNYSGLDAVRLAREAIGLSIATEESQSRLHSNGAKPGGLLSFEKALSPAAKERLKQLAEDRMAGLDNAFRTMVLDGGATWTPFTMTGVDAEHLATRKFQIEEVCRMFGVFPQMVGHADKTATFASAEAFFQAHVTHTLQPWFENWQQVIARDLFPKEDDVYAEFSVQGLLRGDHQARAEYYSSGITNGWMTRNEARRSENLNSIPGLDEPLMPLNLASGSNADKTPAEPAKGQKDFEIGRVLSTSNECRVRNARDELSTVLNSLPDGEPDATP